MIPTDLLPTAAILSVALVLAVLAVLFAGVMKMAKLSNLEAMRLVRDNREREATAPIKASLVIAQSELASMADGFKSLNRIVMSDFGKHVLEEIKHRASRELYPEIAKAVGAKPGEFVTVQVPAESLRFLRPSDAEKHILDRVMYKLQDGTRVKARMDHLQYATIVTVTFPQFTIQYSVCEEALAPRRARA